MSVSVSVTCGAHIAHKFAEHPHSTVEKPKQSGLQLILSMVHLLFNKREMGNAFG